MKKFPRIVSRSPLHMIIIIIALLWLLPTTGILVTSFRPSQTVSQSGWWRIFATPFDMTQYTLKNYESVITRQGIGTAFRNSLLISVPATVLPVLFAAFAAYALAWMTFPGRHFLFMMVVGLLIIPLQMTFIPILKLYNLLHLSGTFIGIWLAHTGYGLPLTVFLLHNFMAGLPKDLLHAAAMDGASLLAIFLRIVIPLSVPAIASVVIFQFLWVWNDLLVALMYLGGAPDVAPLTLKIASLVGSRGQEWEILTAAAFLSIVLPLIVFFSMQKYFVRGILAGSVKG
jgi:alpha-glucoside transport system permease protein